MTDAIEVTYRILSYLPLEQAAEAIAGEQTTGTFTKVAGETPELHRRHRAQVLGITPLAEDLSAALPGARGRETGTLRGGLVRIGYPLVNSGPSLTRMLAFISGNLYELSELAGIKLLDIDFPDEFGVAYPPAPHGVTGTRTLVGRPSGVLLGTIVKPNIGLAAPDYHRVVRELGLAGLDFIKDDEVNADCPPTPLRDRVPQIIRALDDVESETGRRPLYAFNISDEVDHMLESAAYVEEAGGKCVMVNTALVGIPALCAVRRHTDLVIHGHLAGFAAASRHPNLGMGFGAFQKLTRFAGVDHLHVGGFRSKFFVEDKETAANINAVRTPLLGGRECLPVISSAQSAGTAPTTWQHTGTDDLLVLAGGGILGHPGGPAAGARSMRQAWEAVAAGVPLQEAAGQHSELAAALAHFG
ncbi:RuBisCO large subunit C-terminal-like domain-containing protein [Mycobacterium sp. 21AC1]|uniref:RuBisCO large subunit C-terminal-like domain-containing protein n=1 Tax=[Mycobacterium] appelbergii TaxID=2939269 RepID=UPI0029393113|nr:RuBisCO large subunit C-terminal-like domain-containing protein [Mycobacterium sp. 21AC1]MDV3124226.1 RuBisCO large subunit C-terminal-like domain-containing protein [Mycobacterium sp. 21AC1]